jgi:hypothetical protein
MNDNKTRDEELAAATAHYLRTIAKLSRAHDRADKYGSHDAFLAMDKAAQAHSAAGNRLAGVLNQFPKQEGDRLMKVIDAKARKV